MYLDPFEYVQLEILVRGAAEPLTRALIRNIVGQGACVIDVGAHVGHHALEAAAATGSDGQVFAFDPQPDNADRIGCHAVLKDFPNILTICAAVGDNDGFVQLPMQNERDRARLSLDESGPNNQNALVEVPVMRLDTFLASRDIGPIQLLKIDVEGYELEVLNGMGERLTSCSNIVLELHDATSGEKKRAVVDRLTTAGFTLNDVHGRRWDWGAPLAEGNLWASRD